MAAPKGNKYAEGKGRPRKVNLEDLDAFADDMLDWFTEKLDTLIADFSVVRKRLKLRPNEIPPLKEILVDVPTVHGYSKECGVAYRTLKKYCDDNESFRQTYEICKDIQARYITVAAMNGLSDSRFSIFAAMNYGNMRDKRQLSGTDDGPIQIAGVEIIVRK